MEREPNSYIQLPPGFRFYPSDEELIVHYLTNKATLTPLPASIVAEVDLYKYNPWELPKKALFGAEEWYFFTPRDRKYPNGVRPNRMAASGYWKATGTDKPILNSYGAKMIGVKKALVFYEGRPPRGVKTDWIMHEYRLTETMIRTSKHKGSMRLDDWVLCRVRKKSSILKKNWEDQNSSNSEQDYHVPKVEKPCSMDANASLDMIREYLYKECPMLPYIFTSPELPSMDTVSNKSFEGTKAYSSVPLFNGLFNARKRDPIEEIRYKSFIQSKKKKLNNRDDQEEEVLLSVSDESTEMNFCSTESYECNNFNANQWSSTIQYQELHHLAFS
ncbi:NAC domain-containing protein 2-like [Cornus florida]|uniref:NAC domain-containing protein 2-like n=1 Tax=Cornus florida TaxID=4283 RepID=UPI00289A6C5C|nr:NAC domain-containing protein 2-like [Cornus florida]